MSCRKTVFIFRYSHSHSISDSKKSNSCLLLTSIFLLLCLGLLRGSCTAAAILYQNCMVFSGGFDTFVFIDGRH